MSAQVERPELAALSAALRGLSSHPVSELRDLISTDREIIVARAPGRLDVMGGIGDYSGSLVLELPLREATLAAVQSGPEPVLRVASLDAKAPAAARHFAVELPELKSGDLSSPDRALDYFRGSPEQGWASYVVGVIVVLMQRHGLRLDGGLSILIQSDVPEGKGVSSSAALEVSVLNAMLARFELELDQVAAVRVAHEAENRVAGAPCGVMDQMTSHCGEENRLLMLLCQPAEIQGRLEIPDGISLWGIDSGVRHAVSGADYGQVRVGAFMGYRMIAELAGLTVRPSGAAGKVEVTDPRWGGYLANVTPSEFEQRFVEHLPQEVGGSEFLREFAGTTDPVTEIDPRQSYPVRAPTAHPIHEHHRVRRFAQLLRETPTEQTLEELGELMYQSHRSYSACGLGSDATDEIVRLVQEAGPARGLYGAKITGGGSGGAVAVLGRSDAEPALQEVARRYQPPGGGQTIVFRGSSPGAKQFGIVRLVR